MLRFKFNPIATILNMVVALIIDADPPAIKAYNQSRINIKDVLRYKPCLNRSNGFNNRFRISRIIPTCKPETANMCIAPALV